ncbi:hypothetical protein [Allohahella marinimesophila]|uniref:Uncharacterized protein n=1 Tax=Allohahella marinimesophila TaxID=1054972 RepID=A0ABP7P1E2_9GAMM
MKQAVSVVEADLVKAYKSEVAGVQLFKGLLWLQSTEHQQLCSLLILLEQQTQAGLLDLLQRRQIRAGSLLFSKVGGFSYGFALACLPWKLSLRVLMHSADPYLHLFRRLQAQSAPEDHEFLTYLVAHEEALLSFLQQEINGDSEPAVRQIRGMMRKSVDPQPAKIS